MKILVTGSSGLFGSRFVELFSQSSSLLTPSHTELDITNLNQVKSYISLHKPEVVINFAAYTDVTSAENQRKDKEESCWKINVEGTKHLVSVLEPTSIHFIQISTDMVFSGFSDDPGPYSEDHSIETNSERLPWYGYTKAQAEVVVSQSQLKSFAIVRVAKIVRSKFPAKLDYLRKPLKLFDEGKLYPMFNDQYITISFIDDTVPALEKIISNHLRGVYHIGSPDVTNPFEVMSYLIMKSRGVENAVKSSSLIDHLKTGVHPARFPQFGGLKVEATQNKLGMMFSPWREMINKMVEQEIIV